MNLRACSGRRIPPAVPTGLTALDPLVEPMLAVGILPREPYPLGIAAPASEPEANDPSPFSGPGGVAEPG